MITNPENYAAIYARQSNLKYSNSIPSQILKGQETALKNNLLIYKTYSERISATEINYMEREEFKKLLIDAKAGCFKTVIVFKRDRLARKLEDFLSIKKDFSKLGVKILYSNEGEFQSDGSHISDFIENIIMGVSEYEPKNIKSRTEAGRKKKRENKEYCGIAPFGLKGDKTSKNNLNNNNQRISTKYVKDKNNSTLIKIIFDIFVNDATVKNINDIYDKLVEKNIALPKDFKKNKILEIIKKPIYAALQTKTLDLKYKNFILKDIEDNTLDIIPEYFHKCINVEPIIEENIWFKAVVKWKRLNLKKRHTKKTSYRKNYLFKNLLYCGICNNKITLSNNVYTCHQKSCTRINEYIVKKQLLNKLLKSLLKEETIDNAINSKLKELTLKTKKINTLLVKNNLNQSTLIDHYLQDTNNSEIRNSITNAVKEEKKLKKELENLNNKIKYFKFTFKPIVTTLIDTPYIQFVIDKLLRNEEILQELLTQNIEKVIIDGNRKNINIRKIHHKQ